MVFTQNLLRRNSEAVGICDTFIPFLFSKTRQDDGKTGKNMHVEGRLIPAYLYAIIVCGILECVCVLHIKLFFLPVDIQHTQCPCRFLLLERYRLCGHKTTTQRYYIPGTNLVSRVDNGMTCVDQGKRFISFIRIDRAFFWSCSYKRNFVSYSSICPKFLFLADFGRSSDIFLDAL